MNHPAIDKLLAALPPRVHCEHDVEEAYKAFAEAADEFVRSHLPFDRAREHPDRFFITSSDLRYVTDFQLEQARELGIEPGCVTVQALINALRVAQSDLATLREQAKAPTPPERIAAALERILERADGYREELARLRADVSELKARCLP